MWVYSVNAFVCLIFSVFLAWRFFPALRLSARLVSWSRAQEVLGYGAKFSATSMVTILNPVFDKLILARYTGLAEVAFYEAATRLVDLLRRATQLFLLPLFPLAGAQQETRNQDHRNDFYKQIFSANLLLSAGLYLVPASLAFGIFRVWIGPGSKVAAGAFVVLCITVFCQALTGPATMIFAGSGRLFPLMVTAIFGLLLNLTLSPLLASHFGFLGLLVGTAIAYGGASLVFIFWTLSMPEFKMPVAQLVRVGAVPILAGLTPGAVLTLFWRPGEEGFGRLTLFAAAAIAVSVFVALSLTQDVHRSTARRTFHYVLERYRSEWSRSGENHQD
jgi:O-antigen/teichoic acid export membrane protein